MPRDPDILIGSVVLALALATLAGFILWSRRVINRIARRGARTLREITKDRDGV